LGVPTAVVLAGCGQTGPAQVPSAGPGSNVAAAAGDPPGVAQIPLHVIDFAVTNLPAQSIDQIAPPAEYDEMVRHILPQASKQRQLNGHLCGSPYTFSTPTLFYNADVTQALDVYMQAIQNVLFKDDDAQMTMDTAAAKVDALMKEG
jgi:hypothetical protein